MSRIGVLIFFVAALLFLLLNYQPIGSYFSQDDFFHLNSISEKSFIDIPSFFVSLQKDYAFYRPLSRETYNLLMLKIFGLNPMPYHLVNLVLILGIGFLTYLISKKIFGSQLVASLGTIFYLINSVHNVELYYLGSVQILLASLFICISVLFYFAQRKFVSFVFFLLALTSHELAIILPAILILAEKTILRKNFRDILPFIFLSLVYLLFSSLLTSLPSQDAYKPVFNPKNILNALGWYLGWSFGLPEILIDFVGPKLRLNTNFIEWYSDYINIVLPLLIFVISALVISLGLFWNKLNKKILGFLIGAYIISISPFLFFPQHKFIYYLELATVWFSIAIGFVFSMRWKNNILYKLFLCIVLLSMIIIFNETNNLNSTTYWAAKRSQAAKFILEDIKKNYPSVSTQTIFYFTNDPNYPFIAKDWGNSSKQAFYILSGSDALQLLYKDKSIKAYFEDIGKPPKILDNQKMYTITAKFPY